MPLHHDKGCEWSKKKNLKNEKLRISPLNLILLSQLRFLGFEMEKGIFEVCPCPCLGGSNLT